MRLRDLKRLCKTQNYCDQSCPYYEVCGECAENLIHLKDEYIDKIESRCEKWLAEHPEKPKKTRQSELLKLFPNVHMEDGVFPFCPMAFDEHECNAQDCYTCRREYWLAEIKDDEA